MVDPPPEADLDHRRREQLRNVEHGLRTSYLLDCVRDCGVVDVRHDAHVGPQLAHEQDRLERAQIARLDADHRRRAGDPGLEQRLGKVRAARKNGDAPGRDDSRKAIVVAVFEHRNLRAGMVELLDGS